MHLKLRTVTFLSGIAINLCTKLSFVFVVLNLWYGGVYFLNMGGGKKACIVHEQVKSTEATFKFFTFASFGQFIIGQSIIT